MIKLVLWSFFLVPWFSLLFLNNHSIRKYMPVALLATVLNTIVYQIAWTYDWWTYKETLFEWDKVAQVHTVYGVFLVGTIWIFHFTFGRFWIYMIVNLLTDCLYSFGLRTIWKKLEITTSGGKLLPLQSVLIMTIMAIALYFYQNWQEQLYDKDKI